MGGSQPVNPMTGTGQSGLEPSNPVGTATPRPFARSSSLSTDANLVPSAWVRLQRNASISNVSGSTVMNGSSPQVASGATSQSRGPEPGNSSPPLKKQRIDSRQEPVQLQRHADPQLQRIIPNPRFAQYQHQQPQALQRHHMHQRQEPVQLQRHADPQLQRIIPNPRFAQFLHQQQALQQPHMHQRQEPVQLQRHADPQLQRIIPNPRFAQYQHQEQALQQPHMHQQLDWVKHSQQQHQQHPVQIDWVRHSQQQQHPVQPLTLPNDPPVGGLCAQRVMQYINHQRNRPPDNSILYWRKFVAEYFAPVAKKSWCLAALDDGGSHAVRLPSQTTTDSWKCDICGANSQKGFEATYEFLPRFFQIISGHGAIDVVLSLRTPPEQRSLSGCMILEYANAVQESIYEHHRVSHKGKLRIIFTPDLKILSWEFCIRDHEDFFSRTLVASKVNQLVQAAQKCQTVVTEENGSAGLLPQELQTSCNMVVTAGHQLAKSLAPPSLNDLGFPKVFMRSLQVANVVNTMKDLFDFNNQHNFGPMESLKRYPRVSAMLREEKQQEAVQMATAECLPADHNTFDRTGSGDGGTGTSNNTMTVTAPLRLPEDDPGDDFWSDDKWDPDDMDLSEWK